MHHLSEGQDGDMQLLMVADGVRLSSSPRGQVGLTSRRKGARFPHQPDSKLNLHPKAEYLQIDEHIWSDQL